MKGTEGGGGKCSGEAGRVHKRGRGGLDAMGGTENMAAKKMGNPPNRKATGA